MCVLLIHYQVKKAVKQNNPSQESVEKKRRSSHSNIVKTSSNKKTKNRPDPKPSPTQDNYSPIDDKIELIDETGGQATVNEEELVVNTEVISHYENQDR